MNKTKDFMQFPDMQAQHYKKGKTMKDWDLDFMKRDLASAMLFMKRALDYIQAGEYRAAASSLSTATDRMFDATIDQARLGWERRDSLNYKAIAKDAFRNAKKQEKGE